MGIECPQCGVYSAFIAAITATGEPAKKNHDIIARKLSCGHVIGSKKYMEFRSQIANVEEMESNMIREIKEKSAKTRLEAWAQISSFKGGE